MTNQDFTTADFHEYLIKHKLFRLKIWKDGRGFHAIVTTKPDLNCFTQMRQLPYGEYEVILAYADMEILEEAKSFFYGF